MKPLSLALMSVILIGSCGQFSSTENYNLDNFEPVGLEKVRMLDGPFKMAMQADQKWLLDLEPDRLLYRYLLFAGLEPKGEIYGGWESRGISGHSLGHYMSACAMMYAVTGETVYQERVDYIVEELDRCQQARKTGYIGAIPDEDRVWDEIASGDIRSQGFDLNGLWVPWYTQHKLLAGLIDSYQFSGNDQALKIAIKFSDWIDDKFKNLTEEQFQRMLACEFGGMNDALAQLYDITKDERYLALANRFYHKSVMDPLAEQKDQLAGLHANTQVPKIIGSAKIYELTGSQKDSTVAAYFLHKVLADHTYSNGGNSEHEHFGAPGLLAHRLSESSSESCNTYNMLKLAQHAQSWSLKGRWGDYIEKATFNHILASQNPETGMVCYFIPLQAGGKKKFSDPFESFWCCVGSGWENHAKYGSYIYYQKGTDALVVDQYLASRLSLEHLELTMETEFPKSNEVEITIDSVKFGFKTLILRKPGWSDGFGLTVNDQNVDANFQDGYVVINREWKNGDKVVVTWNMKLRTESTPDDPNKLSILYGPTLMAGVMDENIDPLDLPVFYKNPKQLNEWFEVEPQSLGGKTNNSGYPSDVAFKPFYEVKDEKYLVYLDMIPEENLEEHTTRIEEERRAILALENRTTDLLRIGEMQPERDHELKGENTTSGEAFNRKWRHAEDGWFEFSMKIDPDNPNTLMVTYWGGDAGNREFDILVNNKKIATQKLERNKPDQFYEEEYPIDIKLTQGKNKVRVRFQSLPGKIAGGVYGCRMLKTEP